MLVFAGATDGIAPIAAVKAVVPLLTGAAEVRFEIVPGGHLGMLTGRAARGTTWRVHGRVDRPVVEPDDAPPRHEGRTKKLAKKAAAKKAAAKKAPAKKTASRERSAKKPPTRDAIGANPKRRYGSAGSRSLSR